MAPDTTSKLMPRVLPLTLALAALFFAPVASAGPGSDAWDGNWHGSFGIYGWLPGIDAQLGVPVDTGGTAVSKSNNDILDNLLAEKAIKPMIVVMPAGHVNGAYRIAFAVLAGFAAVGALIAATVPPFQWHEGEIDSAEP